MRTYAAFQKLNDGGDRTSDPERKSQSARSEAGTYFIDLNDIVEQRYEAERSGAVKKKYFGEDHTHTTEAGAKLNARSIAPGTKSLDGLSLKQYFSDAAKDVDAIGRDIMTQSGTDSGE